MSTLTKKKESNCMKINNNNENNSINNFYINSNKKNLTLEGLFNNFNINSDEESSTLEDLFNDFNINKNNNTDNNYSSNNMGKRKYSDITPDITSDEDPKTPEREELNEEEELERIERLLQAPSRKRVRNYFYSSNIQANQIFANFQITPQRKRLPVLRTENYNESTPNS
jgi:hypothetical protein